MLRTWRATTVDVSTTAPLARSRVLQFLTVVLLCAVAYSTTPLNFWVADDYNYIFPKGLDRIISFFDPTLRAFYRPLNWTSWAIDYDLWGNLSAGWHITSVLFHVISTLVV